MRGTTVQADGDKVARLRAELGWSQQKLGVEAGLHGMTVSKVERGDRNTEIGTVLLLARTFTEHLGREITIDDLLSEPPPAPAKVANG